MPSQPSPERKEGRALFLDAIAPLRTAQQLGYRQGLAKAAELAKAHPDWSGALLAEVIARYVSELPEHPE